MIEKHRAVLRALGDEDVDLIAGVMGIEDELLVEAVEARGLCQADVVMALLRARDGLPRGETPRPALEDLLVRLARLHRALVERPWPRPWPAQAARLAHVEDHWVAWVREGHVRLGPRGSRWWRADAEVTPGRTRVRVRVGMTVAQLEGLGVPRAEVRAAERAGVLRLSAEARLAKGDAPRGAP